MSAPSAARGLNLPDYPWDTLTPYRQRAAAHADGACDLSIGTPVDPTPEVIRTALAAASDAHGYPTTAGTPELREAIAFWSQEWRGVTVDPAAEVLPSVGSKELVAWLPSLLGLRQAGLAVACPSMAYPTYEMGATLAGVDCRRLDAAEIAAGASLEGIGLLWLNTPGNPTGEVLGVELLRAVVARAREAGIVVASDECYALLNWQTDGIEDPEAAAAPSILDAAVTGGRHDGLLAVYSMSKQSNLAGYRAAFVTGDAALIASLTNTRKHAGMIVPAPIQAAMIAGLRDTAHVREQKARYAARRAVLKPAVEDFGLRIDDSTAGLYLWATRGEDCWETIAELADRGIIAGPGAFYGAAADQHVRLALTASDERIAAAAARLRAN